MDLCVLNKKMIDILNFMLLYAIPNITFVCATAIRIFVYHHCITPFSYEHPTSAIFPHVSWNALQPVGFVSLHELLSRCHGADGQGIRFCYYCPAWVSLRMEIESTSDRRGALRDFGVFYFRRVWNYHMTSTWTLNRCLWERRGWCWAVWSGHNCAVLI